MKPDTFSRPGVSLAGENRGFRKKQIRLNDLNLKAMRNTLQYTKSPLNQFEKALNHFKTASV